MRLWGLRNSIACPLDEQVMPVEVVLRTVEAGLPARAARRADPAARPAYRVRELPAVLHRVIAIRRGSHGAQSCTRYAPLQRSGP